MCLSIELEEMPKQNPSTSFRATGFVLYQEPACNEIMPILDLRASFVFALLMERSSGDQS